MADTASDDLRIVIVGCLSANFQNSPPFTKRDGTILACNRNAFY
jgi:hypothetical protein